MAPLCSADRGRRATRQVDSDGKGRSPDSTRDAHRGRCTPRSATPAVAPRRGDRGGGIARLGDRARAARQRRRHPCRPRCSASHRVRLRPGDDPPPAGGGAPRRVGERGADDQPERERRERSPVLLRPLDRVLGAAPVRARHAGVRARVVDAARAGRRAARAPDRRRLRRPFVLGPEGSEDAGVGVRADPCVPGAAAKPRRARSRPVDRRPQPRHRHAADRRNLGARGRDVAAARQHHRLRGRQRARPLHPVILDGDDRALAARGPAAAARADPGQLRRRLL